jgi:cytochrome P450
MPGSRPVVTVDLTDPGVWEAGVPHSELRRLRDEAPVAWADHPGPHRGFWAVTRHEDVVAVSRDPDTFSSRDGVISLDDLEADQIEARRTMLEEDPPRHRELRALTSAHFTPKAVRAHEGYVRQLAGDAIETAIEMGECDLVTTLSERVPIRVLGRMLGVPDRDVDDLVRFGNQMIGSDDPEYEAMPADIPASELRLLPFGHPAALEAFEIAWRITRSRSSGDDRDVLSALANGMVDGDPLTERELGTYFVLLVIAGNETTRHSISSGVAALATHRSQWRRLRAREVDPTRAADEVLRWATAIHFHRRVATGDTVLRGVEIAAGEKVALYFASANFDDRVFQDPHTFDVGRSPNEHVAFGRGGPHFCLGAHLARLEVRVVLEELAARVAAIELMGEPSRLRSNHINGIKHLPVRLTPV